MRMNRPTTLKQPMDLAHKIEKGNGSWIGLVRNDGPLSLIYL